MQRGGVLGVESESLGGGAQTDCQCLATGKVETAQQLVGFPAVHAVDTVPDTFHRRATQQCLEVTPARHGKDLCRGRNAVLTVEEGREFCTHVVMVSRPRGLGKVSPVYDDGARTARPTRRVGGPTRTLAVLGGGWLGG